MSTTIEFEKQYCAQNYHPLPVVLTKGQGIYVWDENGKQYIDMMSAYSAISHGHCHPRIINVLKTQAEKLAVVSRAFYSDTLGPFLAKACEMFSQDRALPMKSGAEAAACIVCLKLMEKGLLTKDTHETVIRLAPPLIIQQEEIDRAVDILNEVLNEWNSC